MLERVKMLSSSPSPSRIAALYARAPERRRRLFCGRYEVRHHPSVQTQFPTSPAGSSTASPRLRHLVRPPCATQGTTTTTTSASHTFQRTLPPLASTPHPKACTPLCTHARPALSRRLAHARLAPRHPPAGGCGTMPICGRELVLARLAAQGNACALRPPAAAHTNMPLHADKRCQHPRPSIHTPFSRSRSSVFLATAD